MAALYKHYKGGIYAKLAVARDSDEPNTFMVLYRNVDTGELWVRKLAEFEGTVTVNGAEVPRFMPHGETVNELAHIRETAARLTRERVRAVLDKHGGNITRAAKELGWTRWKLYRAMDKFDVQEPSPVSVPELEREITALQGPSQVTSSEPTAPGA